MVVIASILFFLLKMFLFLSALLLFIVILVLVIPFTYSFSALLKGKTILNMEFNWAVIKGSISLEDWSQRIDIAIMGRSISPGKPGRKIRQKTVKEKRKGRFGKPGIAFLREALSFVSEVFDVLKPKEFWARGVYGLDDPADTAALHSVVLMLSSCMPRANVAVYPVFESETRDVEIRVAGRVMLIQLVCITIKYLLKKEVRRVIFRKRINTKTQNINI